MQQTAVTGPGNGDIIFQFRRQDRVEHLRDADLDCFPQHSVQRRRVRHAERKSGKHRRGQPRDAHRQHRHGHRYARVDAVHEPGPDQLDAQHRQGGALLQSDGVRDAERLYDRQWPHRTREPQPAQAVHAGEHALPTYRTYRSTRRPPASTRSAGTSMRQATPASARPSKARSPAMAVSASTRRSATCPLGCSWPSRRPASSAISSSTR